MLNTEKWLPKMQSTVVSNSTLPIVQNIEEYPSSSPFKENAIHIAILAIASGVVMHTTVFRTGEWDVAAPLIVASYVFALLATTLLSTSQLDASLMEVVQTAAHHFTGLFSSMLIYRAFFHRPR
jgi:hypothetical protein